MIMEKEYLAFLVKDSLSVLESLKVIDSLARGIVFVVDSDEHLIGSLTDGDVRRFILSGGQLTEQVSCVCNKNCYSVNHMSELNWTFINVQKISVVPIISADFKINAIWAKDGTVVLDEQKNNSLSEVPVVIMAGGQGTRLYPFTKILPKPLIPIGEKPIAEIIIDHFTNFGVKDFIFSVNYKANMIRAYFNDIDHDYTVGFIKEDQPLGTAGSLFLLQDKLDKTFFVVNCDILIQANYAKILDYHQNNKNQITLVGAVRDYQIPYGIVEYNENRNGTVTAINEKPTYHFTVNTGMYILEPEVLDFIPENTFFHITDLIEKIIASGGKVGCYPVHGDAWMDMGQLEEMQDMIKKLGIK